MKKWTAYAAIATGLLLTVLYLFEVISVSPYSTFAVLAGAALVVDGVRRVRELRRTQAH
ncbi:MULTISPECIES: hypothetical protein [Streptomyces]|uniref:Uncharacterized protein n=1 Tax=Streptomyces venezuelae (strain ATCC 10712 / CBS 650.69 / DSM 40230 / JCM 4526 / NBRC 13096 / PD 04745) TaxID=953739 RepID=F2RC69_STRVP|nr:hypothetical protein [Streptomyces venezuelae]CCA59320.1 hypothetical protein SVEN_6034 [Streptomyces venezuelae ATCC 10712]